MPKLNPATVAKHKAQRAEAIAHAIYKSASDRHVEDKTRRLYWVVNTTSNRRASRPVTFEEFNRLVHHSVRRIYKLYPAN